MSTDLADPRFWLALAIGIGCLALFAFGLATGGRRRE
jgi:hypothetical protein